MPNGRGCSSNLPLTSLLFASRYKSSATAWCRRPGGICLSDPRLPAAGRTRPAADRGIHQGHHRS